MYRTIACIPPCDAIFRSSAISVTSRDTYVSAKEIGGWRYSTPLLEAIDYAMQFRRQDRPQTIAERQATFIKTRLTDDVEAVEESCRRR